MPIRALIYGAEGVGKTTLCAGAPNPILIGADSGSCNIDIDRMPEPQTWQDVLLSIDEIATGKHNYKTLVIDPLGWIEALIHRDITGGNCTIEDANGGFGRGHSAALDQFRIMIAACEVAWKRENGMNVLFTAHSLVKTFHNPEGADYDRYQLSMNEKAAGLIRQWVDFVLFARIETFASKEKGAAKYKGATGGRIINTTPCAAYDAKARCKIADPLPMSWDSFYGAINAESEQTSAMIRQLLLLAEEIDESQISEYVGPFIKKNSSNPDRLAELINKLTIKLEKKKEAAAK